MHVRDYPGPQLEGAILALNQFSLKNNISVISLYNYIENGSFLTKQGAFLEINVHFSTKAPSKVIPACN